MKKAILLLALGASAAHAESGGKVQGSRHDFSLTGQGPGAAAAAASPCIYCHISHGGGDELSNRPESAASHRTWESGRGGKAGAPTGSTRTCLSCHDGTVAISATRKRPRDGARHSTEARIAPGQRGYLGTDLRESHPVSLRPMPGGTSHAPRPGDRVALDRAGEVQCTSCHDPHRSDGDPILGKFLVKPLGGSALCTACHAQTDYAAEGSIHATSAASLPGDVPADELAALRSVGGAGCAACHASHGTRPGAHLVVRGAAGTDDSACLRCHAGGVARADVAIDYAKPYSHAVGGSHDANEGPDARGARLPETAPGTRRHAACVDCHNPHKSSSAPPVPPYAGGALAGVWGIDLNGLRVAEVQFEYQVCFKCHADSANQPQSLGPTPPDTVRRAVTEVNLRRVFGPRSYSSHPVATPRRQPDVPSLLKPWSAAPGITCSDCHSSNGGGARGPHGSAYPHLLAQEYRTTLGTPESPQTYALCYKCHDREKILDETAASGFPWHKKHLVNWAATCSSCHNAHGVSDLAGTPTGSSHLIDFDLSVVGKAASGGLGFRDAGVRAGSCALRCHSGEHDGVATGVYSPAKLPTP
jgi:predicted CXXCH cytochrome family protein